MREDFAKPKRFILNGKEAQYRFLFMPVNKYKRETMYEGMLL